MDFFFRYNYKFMKDSFTCHYLISDCIKLIFECIKPAVDIKTLKEYINFCFSTAIPQTAYLELLEKYRPLVIPSTEYLAMKKIDGHYNSMAEDFEYTDFVYLVSRSYIKSQNPELISDFSRLIQQGIDDFANSPETIKYHSKYEALKKVFLLSDLELSVIRYLMCIIYESSIYGIFKRNPSDHARNEYSEILNFLLNRNGNTDKIQIRHLMNKKSKLIRFGLLQYDYTISSFLFEYLDDRIEEIELRSIFFKLVKNENNIALEQFAHFSHHTSILEKLIQNHKGIRPLNILFYGNAGTGKTSYAKALADGLGHQLYEIPCIEMSDTLNDDQQVPVPGYRTTAIHLCESFFDPLKSIVLIDECDHLLITNNYENIFQTGRSYYGTDQKLLINQTLEGGKAVRFWITNNISRIDPSTRRRFDYSIAFPSLDKKQREALWKEVFKTHSIQSDTHAEITKELADQYEINAGSMDNIVKNHLQMKEHTSPTDRSFNHEEAIPLINAHLRLLKGGGEYSNSMNICHQYSLNTLNIKGLFSAENCIKAIENFFLRLKGLEQGILRSSAGTNLNFLLQGPPGTGKTEFVKYVAKHLGIHLIVKSASNLLGVYLGETERNIAQAFEEASARKSILFIDEADSLFQKRQNAIRSWEISQTSEFLIQMERFTGILICATNFHSHMDQALMRRFPMKLEFDYLTPEHKIQLFEDYFHDIYEKPHTHPKEIASIDCLTHGDFKAIRQKYIYLDIKVPTSQLIDDLGNETGYKKDFRNTQVGFR